MGRYQTIVFINKLHLYPMFQLSSSSHSFTKNYQIGKIYLKIEDARGKFSIMCF